MGSVEVIRYGIGVCGNELGSASRYAPPPSKCRYFGTEASELNTVAGKTGRTSKPRVGLLDIRCCKTVVGSRFAIFVILLWRIQSTCPFSNLSYFILLLQQLAVQTVV